MHLSDHFLRLLVRRLRALLSFDALGIGELDFALQPLRVRVIRIRLRFQLACSIL